MGADRCQCFKWNLAGAEGQISMQIYTNIQTNKKQTHTHTQQAQAGGGQTYTYT